MNRDRFFDARSESAMSEGRVEGRRRRRDEGNPNFSEGNPSRVEEIPNLAEGNPNSNASIPSQNLVFSMTYADPRTPGHFSLFEADSGCKCRGKAGVACSPPSCFVGRSVFVFGSSGLFKRVKGWRLFMIADVFGAVPPDLSAAEPD
jgi:hypothetical protein